MDLISALLRTERQRTNAPAIIDGDLRLSWGEFVARAGRVASACRALGTRPGQPVAILSCTSVMMFEFFYGVPWAGGMICPLNYRLSLPELSEILADAGIETLVVDDMFADMGRSLQQQHPQLRNLIHSGSGATPEGMIAYEALLAAHMPLTQSASEEEDLACLYYSGGTTGKAKGVMLTHGNVFANTINFALATGISDEDRVLHCGPLFHVAGGSRIFNACTFGASNVIMPRFEAGEVLANIERYGASFISLVPTMIDTIIHREDFDDYDISRLRFILYGAAQITPTLMEKMIRKFKGVQFSQAYGQTETAPFATILAPRYHCLEGPYSGKLASVGRAVGNVQIRVVDSEDRDVAAGTIGEVIIRGPNVMKGYFNLPELSAQALRGGWMHSGDLGYLDDDGFLYIVDRIKDMIISGGENVYSVEVENAIASHPDVAECAVFGVPDKIWGERVHAVVVPRTGATLDADMIVRHCRTRIGGFKLPRSVDIRFEPLPLSGANKVLKKALREEYDASVAAD